METQKTKDRKRSYREINRIIGGRGCSSLERYFEAIVESKKRGASINGVTMDLTDFIKSEYKALNQANSALDFCIIAIGLVNEFEKRRSPEGIAAILKAEIERADKGLIRGYEEADWDDRYDDKAEDDGQKLDRVLEIDLSCTKDDEIIFNLGRRSAFKEVLRKLEVTRVEI